MIQSTIGFINLPVSGLCSCVITCFTLKIYRVSLLYRFHMRYGLGIDLDPLTFGFGVDWPMSKVCIQINLVHGPIGV